MKVQLRADARENLEKILKAAGEVFAEHGLDSTLAEVAGRAGVGIGTLYRRFSSKEELVVAVFAARVESLVEAADEALRGEDAWTSFVDYLRGNVTMLSEDRGLRELLVSAPLTSVSTEFLEALEDMGSRLAERMERLVDWAQAEGGLSPAFAAQDIPLVTTALLNARELGGEVRGDLDERLLDLMLAGIRPQDPPSSGAPPLAEAEIGRLFRLRT